MPLSVGLFKVWIDMEVGIGLFGVGCGILLFAITALLNIWQKKKRKHTIKRAVIPAIIAIILNALLIFGISRVGASMSGGAFLIVFLLFYPAAFIQGILGVYALIELYLALAESEMYLPHMYRGILCIVGAGLALIAFYFLPIFKETYAPPAHFPTVINGVHVTAFSHLIYFSTVIHEVIYLTPIGLAQPFTIFLGLLILLLFGLLSLRWEAFPLLVATQFLFVMEMLLWYYLFFASALIPGGSNDDAVANFQKSLGNKGLAIHAAEYFISTPAIGFYILIPAFLLITIAMFAPANQNESAKSSMRSLLLSIGAFVLFEILTHLQGLNAIVISWQHQSGVTQFIGNQIEGIATAGFWPLIGAIVGSILVVIRQRNMQAAPVALDTQ